MKKNYLNFKKAALALSFAAVCGATNVEAQVSVMSTAGTSTGTYSTLSDVFTAINNGTHQGIVTVSITANITETTAPVALLASGNGTTSYTGVYIKPSGGSFIVTNSNATADRGIIELAGADSVVIDGDDPATAGLQNLTISANTTTNSGIACIRLSSNSTSGIDGANDVTIRNCIIKGSRSSATSTATNYGIQFSDGIAASSSTLGAYSSTNTVIQGNTITRCYYGIHAIGNSTTYLNTGSIVSNTIGSATASDNIGFRGIDLSYTGIGGLAGFSISRNNIMFGNTSASFAVMGIQVGDANSALTISRNNIHDATASPQGAYGIGLTSSVENAGIMISNNFIRDMKGTAATTIAAASQTSGIGGIGVMVTASVTGLMINNNTIAQLTTGSGNGVQINDANASVSQFMNNAVVNAISGANIFCFYTTATTNIATGTVNNNDYFINATSGNVGYYGGAYRSSLATWKTATSMDANSYSVMPGFVNGTDLHIVAGQFSFLESTGAPTASTNVTNDIDGDVRPGPVGSVYGGAQNPDIGADEFDGFRADCVAPTLTITPSSGTVVCSGSTPTLTVSGADTYTWSTGENTATIAVTPTMTMTYSVIGTTTAGCSNSMVITLTTDVSPTVTAVSSATAICMNQTVSITGSGATTYTLSNGSNNGAAFSPTVTDTYTVTGENTCGTADAVISITVNTLPTLTLTSSTSSLCTGATNDVTLSVNGNAANYTWPGYTVTTSVLTDTPIGVTSPTSVVKEYTVVGHSAEGCTVSAVSDVTVITTPNIPPVLASGTPGWPLILCTGGTATLYISGAANYTWLPGNATTSIVTVSPTTASGATTVANYTVISANDVCTASHTIDVTVNPLPPVFAVVSPTIACAGLQATLTGGAALDFTWSPVTTPSTGANVVIQPLVPTTYSFTGTDGVCLNSGTIDVAVNPVPTIAIVATPSVLCSGSLGVISASGGNSYTWTVSNSTTQLYGPSITINPLTTTAYTVVGDNSVNCTTGANTIVPVNPLPSMTVTPSNTTVCLGRTITINATGPALHFSWNGSPTFTGAISVSPTLTTTYSVVGTSSITNCSSVRIATVHIFNPAFHVTHDTSTCKGTSVVITATGANTYTWQPGNILSATAAFSPSVNSTYSVTGASTVVGTNSVILTCQASYTVGVSVNPNPTVTASTYNHIICRDETATLTAGGALTYTWHPAPASGTGSVVVVNSTNDPNYVNATLYTVTGADANHCKATATVQVITSGCVGIDEQTAFNNSISVYPNPNNGVFTVKTDQNITLNMISELGQTVRTITLSDSNDHAVNVSDVANGIYFLIGSNQNGSVKQKIIISK